MSTSVLVDAEYTLYEDLSRFGESSYVLRCEGSLDVCEAYADQMLDDNTVLGRLFYVNNDTGAEIDYYDI